MAGLSTSMFRKLLHCGDHSDFRITCRGIEFEVHKLIIASASEFFRVVSAKEGFPENATGVVDLPDDEPEVVARALVFLYTGEYESSLCEDVAILLGQAAPAPSHSAVSLKQLGEGVGNQNCSHNQVAIVSTVPEQQDQETPRDEDKRVAQLRINTLVYCFADKVNIATLQERAFDDFRTVLTTYGGLLGGLADAVTLAYECTSADDQQLRFFITEQCIESYESVASDEDLLRAVQMNEPMAWKVAYPKEKLNLSLKKQLKETVEARETAEQSADKFRKLCTELKGDYDTTRARLDNALQTQGNRPTTTTGALVKHCPHCGEKDIILSNTNNTYQNKSLTTICLACNKKWIFAASN